MNKVQILGLIIILASIFVEYIFDEFLELLSGILIGLGAGLMVYKSIT